MCDKDKKPSSTECSAQMSRIGTIQERIEGQSLKALSLASPDAHWFWGTKFLISVLKILFSSSLEGFN